MIELRFYNERYNMDQDYYLGDEDIYLRLQFSNCDELEQKWDSLFDEQVNGYWLEGETYSAWQGDSDLCGGAFDPGDIEYIKENYVEEIC